MFRENSGSVSIVVFCLLWIDLNLLQEHLFFGQSNQDTIKDTKSHVKGHKN